MTAFCPTAAFNENIMPFMTKWLRDLASELGPDVSMPQVVPNILGNQQDGAAFWGDVVTVLPWTLYRAYGDKRILQYSYDSMKHWVEFIESQCGENGLWQTGFQYGDWLGLDAEANALCDERKGAPMSALRGVCRSLRIPPPFCSTPRTRAAGAAAVRSLCGHSAPSM